MNDVTAANFGLLIAFLLPGFVTLWGIGEFSPIVHAWLTGAPEQSPTVGGFLYVTLGTVAMGLLVSTVRWLVIDTIHHRTGIAEPAWNLATLNQNLAIRISRFRSSFETMSNMTSILHSLGIPKRTDPDPQLVHLKWRFDKVVRPGSENLRGLAFVNPASKAHDPYIS
jgi:hypothetical protein